MKTHKLLICALATAAALVGSAQPLSYGRSTVQIKAGTLLIESQRVGGQPWNAVPHAWFTLDQDRSIKPASWSIVNPNGSTTLSAAAALRWAANPMSGGVPGVGTRLTKADAPYWEVILETSTPAELASYDILRLSVSGALALNSLEREKLRGFVDQGGILWVDLVNEGSLAIDEANGTPYAFIAAISGAGIEANLLHPMLSYPNQLSYSDLVQMDYPPAVPTVTQYASLAAAPALGPILAPVSADTSRLEAVAGNAAGRTISVARLGDGYMAVTSRGVTATLNRGRLDTPGNPIQANRGFRSLSPVHDASFSSSAKLAVNIMSLSSQHSMVGAGSRKTNRTSATVEAPLLRQFNDTLGGGGNTTPSLFKGYLVTTVGGQVVVYDANPKTDLDGDGNPDDGVQQVPGATSDLVWSSAPLGGNISSATVVEVPQTALPAINQVWVSSDNGNVYVFGLESTGTAVPPLTTIAPPTGASVGGGFAPVVHEGQVFVADTRVSGFGRIWIIDLNSATPVTTGANAWSIHGASQLQEVSSGPTVGYIPIQDGSSGLDRVIYAPLASAPARPAGVASVWLGARGEEPVTVAKISNRVRLTLRASLQGLPVALPGANNSLGVKVTIVDASGNPFSLGQMSTNLTGDVFGTATNGEIEVELTAAGDASAIDWDGTLTPGVPGDDVGWRIDYSIDWSRCTAGTTPGNSFVRGNLEFPDDLNNNRLVVGSPALTSEGHLIVATSSPNPGEPGGTVFNLVESGRGEFDLVSRWDLFDALTIRLNNSSSAADNIPYRETLIDEDALLTDLPFLASPMSNMRIVSPPAVHNDVVYVLAGGAKPIGFGSTDTAALIALKAHPEPVEFEIDAFNNSNDRNQMSLVQPDYAKSSNKSAPEQTSILARSRWSAERIPGTTRFRITINSLMANSRGTIRDSLTTSLPVILRQTQATDRLIEPETVGNARGRFSPLLWYTVLNGFRATSGPVVAGETMYVGGASLLPSLFANGFSSPPSENGMVFAYDSVVSQNDPFIRSNSVKPWQLQLNTVLKNSAAPFDFRVANALQWPQFEGITSGYEAQVRLLQAAIEENEVTSLAAGDGGLAVRGPGSIYGFREADFFVADEGRIARFDAAGNPLWTLTQTLSAGVDQPVISAARNQRLSLPTRVYKAGNGTYWVVDTGAGRILQTDSAGRELRTISRFRIHPSLTPQGFKAAEGTDFKSPSDMLEYTSTKSAAQVATIFPGETLVDPAGPELWRHMVIADSGSRRVIEVVDRYRLDATGRVIGIVRYADPTEANPVAALSVLLWHSPEELSGQRYAYNSVDRIFVSNGGPLVPAVAFGFSNAEPGRATVGLDSPSVSADNPGGTGGVIVYNGPETLVISEFEFPAIAANTFMGATSPTTYEFNLPTANAPAYTKKIVGLRSVTLKQVTTGAGPRLAVMIAESTGVYELVQADPSTPAGRNTWVVNWMLPRDAYSVIRRPNKTLPAVFTTGELSSNASSFRPMYARRMDSGDVLLVNGYMGTTTGGSEFNGEVAVIEGRNGNASIAGYILGAPNLGFGALSVKYELPPVQGVRGLVRPTFAARQ